MNDAQLRQQPRDVRDEFERMSDGQFDSDKQIVGLKSKLRAAQAKFQSANQKNDRIRAILGNLQSDVDQTKKSIEEIDAQRADVIAMALIDETDFGRDDELLGHRLELERRIERLAIARPALESRQRARAHEVAIAHAPCAALEEQIADRRDTLKLTEARRRHGFA